MIRRGFGWLFLVSALAASGCGPSLQPVEGILKMDGSPLAGASVTFVSEDGNKTYTANSDTDGKFALATGDKLGIASGNYKVLIVKYPKAGAPVAEGLKPSDPEYLKQMEKNKKDAEKAAKAAMSPPPATAGSGMRPPMGMMPGGGAAAPPPKSELPAVYASFATTTVTVAVPLQTTPVVIDIKGNAPKK